MSPEDRPKDRPAKGAGNGPKDGGMAQQARAWAIALDMVYYMLGGGLMGFGIDYLAKTYPLWMLILGGVGLVVGVYKFVTEALRLVRGGGKRPPAGRG